jgi:hypothetical protein
MEKYKQPVKDHDLAAMGKKAKAFYDKVLKKKKEEKDEYSR